MYSSLNDASAEDFFLQWLNDADTRAKIGVTLPTSKTQANAYVNRNFICSILNLTKSFHKNEVLLLIFDILNHY